MKVHKLINALLGMPAGAEVKVRQYLTVEELTESKFVGVKNGSDVFCLTRDVTEADEVRGSVSGSVVYLYTD